MGPRRSERRHKVTDYAKLEALDDEDDDFADILSTKKRSRIENSTIHNKTKNKDDSLKRDTSIAKKRLPLGDRVFERQVRQAIVASHDNVIEHIVFKKSNTAASTCNNHIQSCSEDASSGNDSFRAEEEDFNFKSKSDTLGNKRLQMLQAKHSADKPVETQHCSFPIRKQKSDDQKSCGSITDASEVAVLTSVVQDINNGDVNSTNDVNQDDTCSLDVVQPDLNAKHVEFLKANIPLEVESPKKNIVHINNPIPSLKSLKAMSPENPTPLQRLPSVFRSKLPNLDNTPGIKSCTSPLKLPPKRIRLGLSRKVTHSLHPSVKKSL